VRVVPDRDEVRGAVGPTASVTALGDACDALSDSDHLAVVVQLEQGRRTWP
jgi:hypothetical protein